MKKLLLTMSIGLSYFLCFSQSWSSMNYTTELPLVFKPPTPTDPKPEYFGAMEIMSDAIITNTGNSNSIFDEGTVFVIYSPLREEEPNTEWLYLPNSQSPGANQEIGAWLWAFNRAGNPLLRRKIIVPNSFNIARDKISLPNYPLSYLRVASLRYDFNAERELLVFTGSVRRDNGHIPNTTNEYEVMVVGTYDLTTNNVQIKAVDDFYTINNECRPVGSEGVSVRSIGEDHFMAIGQSGNVNSSPTSSTDDAYYPMGMIFSVDNSGTISVKTAEVEDFTFKPLSASKVGRNDKELVVAGIQHYNQRHVFALGSGSGTFYSPSVFSFEAINSSGTWSIYAQNGIALNTDAYHDGNQPWTKNYSHIDIFEDGDRVFVGTSRNTATTTTTHERGTGNPVFFELDINLTSVVNKVEYDLYNDPLDKIDPFNVGVHRLIPISNEEKFKVVMVSEDVLNYWGNPNNTGIAIMEMDYSGGGLTTDPSYTFHNVYTDDDPLYNVSDFSHVTGIYEEDAEGTYGIYFADHLYHNGSGACNYVYGVIHGDYSCPNMGEIQPATVQTDEVIYGTQLGLSNKNIYTGNPDVENISNSVYSCEYGFFREPLHRNKASNFSTIEQLEKADGTIEPYVVSLGNNVYGIRNVDFMQQNYVVYNAAGQELNLSIINNELDLSEQKAGVYFLRFQNNGKTYSEKLIAN